MSAGSLWKDERAGRASAQEMEASALETVGLRGRPRIKAIDRSQTLFRVVIIERLIEEDHPARAVWEFVSRLDLDAFKAPIKAVEGVAGRKAWDPYLLTSVWIYAYSRGIGAAREVERRCEYDPAFQWLTGLGKINHHTLSDFRVEHGAALDELFTKTLGVLSAQGLVTLERVMQDGTKIKANAGGDSFRRGERIQKHLEAARAQVEAMGDPREDGGARQRAARERAKRERVGRLERALEQWDQIRQGKAGTDAKEQARASLTDPEARIMKQGNGGYAPSYNAQLATDAAHGIVVGVGLSQAASDYGELVPAVERVERNLGRPPEQVVVDGGFTSRENIMEAAEKGVDLIGSLDEHNEQSAGQMRRRGVAEAFYPAAFTYEALQDQYRCPAGKLLRPDGQEKRVGATSYKYRAGKGDCASCEWKGRCCPQNEAKGRSIVRTVEAPAVQHFIDKMKTDAARAIYRLRGAVAEFPNAWIKEKIGLRQFHVRGLCKARTETVWACLAYNIMQWMRLCWRKESAAAMN